MQLGYELKAVADIDYFDDSVFVVSEPLCAVYVDVERGESDRDDVD